MKDLQNLYSWAELYSKAKMWTQYDVCLKQIDELKIKLEVV